MEHRAVADDGILLPEKITENDVFNEWISHCDLERCALEMASSLLAAEVPSSTLFPVAACYLQQGFTKLRRSSVGSGRQTERVKKNKALNANILWRVD